MVHLLVPQLDGTPPLLTPSVIQVQNEIDAPPPVLSVVVVREVRVHVQESAANGLMEPGTFQGGVRQQARDASQIGKPVRKRWRVQLVNY